MSGIPPDMAYVRIDRPGPPEVLVPARMPVPTPGRGEVLIKVAAAGLNGPDLLRRQGNYPPPPGASEVPGLEVAGEIAAVGEDVDRWRVGDLVMALVSAGGYAEYCTAPDPQVLPVPSGISLIEAGGIPETFFTVWTNVFDRAHLSAGETLLVHGGTSGIGTTVIQLAHAFGATVFATAGSEDKQRACVALGAKRAINYRSEDFVHVLRAETGGKGVDVILDIVGGSYVERNLQTLALDGRLVQIAWLEGAKVQANFMRLLLKRLTWTGSTLQRRSIAEKGEIAKALEAKVWPLLAQGKVRPLLHATFPLADAAAAHRLMESGAHIGKIVLVP